MKLDCYEHKGILFLSRPKTSDYKTFEEVIVRNTYEKSFFKIQKDEKWIDLGGNVGAFALKAISKGAIVDIYEPDPFNCKMIEHNLKANNFDANIYQKAVVSTSEEQMFMYVGNNKMVWRNSLYKNWGNEKFKVPCIHFSKVLNDEGLHCKMDIEGAEMSILEGMKENFPKKLVAEWSLDIDRSLTRYRSIVDKLSSVYKIMKYSNQLYELPDESLPRNIPAAYDNFYCIRE